MSLLQLARTFFALGLLSGTFGSALCFGKHRIALGLKAQGLVLHDRALNGAFDERLPK